MPSDLLGAGTWTSDAEEAYRRAGELLAEFEYKPGWTFDLSREVLPNRIFLRATFHAPDSRNPSRKVPVMGTFYTSPDQAAMPEYFWRWLYYCIGTMEDHEMNEWFRVRGELIYDPHKEAK